MAIRRARRQPVIFAVVMVLLIWAYWQFESHQHAGRRQKAQVKEQTSKPRHSQHLVVATLKGDDTTWIQKRLKPEWGVSIYVANSKSAPLTVPVNKGREAQVYLTYLIDHYDNLPDVMVFIHGRQFQWHNDDPNYDGATVLSRLQIPYIREQGYVNLRCVWVLGCPDEVHVNAPRVGHEAEVSFREGFVELFPERAARDEIPEVVGASCCAQFALTREKVREHPREEYIRIRKWLTDTTLPDNISGRIMEYSWHMIFGRDPVHCPNAPECYCKVFGMCDLEACSDDACPGRYKLPQFSTQPADWEPLPEFDNVSYAAEWARVEQQVLGP